MDIMLKESSLGYKPKVFQFKFYFVMFMHLTLHFFFHNLLCDLYRGFDIISIVAVISIFIRFQGLSHQLRRS